MPPYLLIPVNHVHIGRFRCWADESTHEFMTPVWIYSKENQENPSCQTISCHSLDVNNCTAVLFNSFIYLFIYSLAFWVVARQLENHSRLVLLQVTRGCACVLLLQSGRARRPMLTADLAPLRSSDFPSKNTDSATLPLRPTLWSKMGLHLHTKTLNMNE